MKKRILFGALGVAVACLAMGQTAQADHCSSGYGYGGYGSSYGYGGSYGGGYGVGYGAVPVYRATPIYSGGYYGGGYGYGGYGHDHHHHHGHHQHSGYLGRGYGYGSGGSLRIQTPSFGFGLRY